MQDKGMTHGYISWTQDSEFLQKCRILVIVLVLYSILYHYWNRVISMFQPIERILSPEWRIARRKAECRGMTKGKVGLTQWLYKSNPPHPPTHPPTPVLMNLQSIRLDNPHSHPSPYSFCFHVHSAAVQNPRVNLSRCITHCHPDMRCTTVKNTCNPLTVMTVCLGSFLFFFFTCTWP